MYGVTEKTVNNWRRNKRIPIIEITPQQKGVYQEDLISWEKQIYNNLIIIILLLDHICWMSYMNHKVLTTS